MTADEKLDAVWANQIVIIGKLNTLLAPRKQTAFGNLLPDQKPPSGKSYAEALAKWKTPEALAVAIMERTTGYKDHSKMFLGEWTGYKWIEDFKADYPGIMDKVLA